MVHFYKFMKTTVCWTCVIYTLNRCLKWAFLVQAFLVLGLSGTGPFWKWAFLTRIRPIYSKQFLGLYVWNIPGTLVFLSGTDIRENIIRNSSDLLWSRLWCWRLCFLISCFKEMQAWIPWSSCICYHPMTSSLFFLFQQQQVVLQSGWYFKGRYM